MGRKQFYNKQIQIQFYAPPELASAIKELSEKTKVPMSHYFREGLLAVLKKNGVKIDF